jgi:DNA repair exonuclease
MRCLVVADLHYSLPQFDWLLSAAPHFELVIFAGDALDVGSLVDFRAQIVVVRKYLTLLSGITRVILCSGNHDLDERSPGGRKDLAMDRRGPRARRCLRRRQPDHRRHSFHGLSVVGWTACEAADRQPASRGCRSAAEAMDLGPSRAAGEFPGELGRQALLRRRRTRAMDRELPAFDGDLGPRASIAFISDGSWFDRLGATWVFNTGLQPGRPPVYIVLDIDDGRAFWLSAASEQCIDLNGPMQRPAQPVAHPPAWLTSLGQIADPILAKPASATD